MSWIKKASGPASAHHECSDIDAEASKNRLTLVYKGEEGSPLFEQFMKVAKDASVNQKFEFKHAHGCDSHGIDLHRNFDEPVVHFEGEHTAEAIVEFAIHNSVATLIRFNPDEIENVFGSQKVSMFLFSEEDEESHVITEVTKAAKELKGDIQFVVAGVTDGFDKKVGDFFGVTKQDTPMIIFLSPSENMKKYHAPGDIKSFTVEDYKNLLTSFRAGELAPHVKT